MKRSTVGLVALVVLVAIAQAIPARAAIQMFTDESTFKANLVSFTTYNFESFPQDQWITLDTQIPGIDFDNSIVGPDGMGGSYRSPPNVVLNADYKTLKTPIIFTFDTPEFAVGLFNSSVVDAETFEVYDVNDNLLGAIYLPDASVNFGGFIADVGIKKGVVVPAAPTNGSIYIDDLTVGAPIPEPSTFIIWSLLGALTITIGWWRRRRAA